MLNIFTINFNENLDIIFMHGESKGEISKLIKKKEKSKQSKDDKKLPKMAEVYEF